MIVSPVDSGVILSVKQKQRYVSTNTDDNITGAVVLLTPQRQVSRVYTIAIDQSVRQQGIGTALLQHALALSDQLGYQRCHLEVRLSDSPAQQWYRRHGFQALEHVSSYYYDGTDALRMVRLHNSIKSSQYSR